MHDSRVGRFFAVDPLAAKYPWYTPYSFSGNKVINSTEVEGLEDQIVIHYNGQENPTIVSIENTEAKVYNSFRNSIYQSIPNKALAERGDFANWGTYNISSLISGEMIDRNGVWHGPERGTLHMFYGYGDEVIYAFDTNDEGLVPKMSMGQSLEVNKKAWNWYLTSDDRNAKGFRNHWKNTVLAASAWATGGAMGYAYTGETAVAQAFQHAGTIVDILNISGEIGIDLYREDYDQLGIDVTMEVLFRGLQKGQNKIIKNSNFDKWKKIIDKEVLDNVVEQGRDLMKKFLKEGKTKTNNNPKEKSK